MHNIKVALKREGLGLYCKCGAQPPVGIACIYLVNPNSVTNICVFMDGKLEY